jgi:putative transport protein
MLQQFLSHPVAVLFLIVAIGSALGSIKVANISLGASGVLFVALLFGHLGLEVPGSLQELGIILFVYAVGLQAGPRFFRQFKARGVLFAWIGVSVVLFGAGLTWLVTMIAGIEPALALGMFAGAMTSTPGLAAAMDAARDPMVSVGYGIAYPFGVVGMVLLVQALPRLMRVDLEAEEQKIRNTEFQGQRVARRQFLITNPACEGKTLADLKLHRFIEVNITRVRRDNKVTPLRLDFRLKMGDVLMAVGQEDELDKLQLLFGEVAQGEELMRTEEVIARDVLVTHREMTGKSLAELGVLDRYGVVVTRVFRDDMEFVPTGRFVLEIGDAVRVTGSREDCETFVHAAGQHDKRVHETSILALSLGIFLGVMLGFKEFSLPGGASFRLGLAGGPLFVSLILAHYGRIGKLNIRIPRGAKYIMSQLGLVLFLAGAGASAGGSFAEVVGQYGVKLLVAGAVITVGAALAGLIVSHWILKMDMLSTLGTVSGAMTSTPALGAISDVTDSRQPLLTYAAVYPVALILMTVTCQFLIFLL